MALNKKSGLVVALIIIAVSLVYLLVLRGVETPNDVSQIQGDVSVNEQSKVNEVPQVSENNIHEDGHNHDNSAINTSTETTNSVFADLRIPSPLTVRPLLGTRSIGDPNAPVKITEVFSLTCSHCAAFHNETYPQIKENFIDTGKVYWTYQEFPLNAPALHASMIARCLPAERYSGFIDILFETQDRWSRTPDYKEALRQNAKLAGMSDEDFDACLDNKELQEALASAIQEVSEKWEVKATPSIIFNDGEKVVTGAQKFPAMENALNQFIARDMAKKAIEKHVEEQKMDDLGVDNSDANDANATE